MFLGNYVFPMHCFNHRDKTRFSLSSKTHFLLKKILIVSFHLLNNFINSIITFFVAPRLLYLCYLFHSIDSMFGCSPRNQVFFLTGSPILLSLPKIPFLIHKFINTTIPQPNFCTEIPPSGPTTDFLNSFEESSFPRLYQNQLAQHHMKVFAPRQSRSDFDCYQTEK